MERSSNREAGSASRQDDFSLILGGPLYQFFLRTGLARPPLDGVNQRVLAFITVTWVPLFLFATMSGTLLSGTAVPLLQDIDLHVRFLIAMPLLLEAEVIVHNRIRAILVQFVDHGLIEDDELKSFAQIEAWAIRFRNSPIAELLIIVIALVGGYWIWNAIAIIDTGTWYATKEFAGTRLTAAGWWYVFISLPIIRFVLLRWYYRITIWYCVLWKISRLKLQLNPLHPDGAGGLAFLGASFDAFSLILVAQSSFVAGLIGNKIWHQQAQLANFKLEIAVMTGWLLLLAMLPLFFFMPVMARAKREGLPSIRALAARYAREFRKKWCDSSSGLRNDLLGSADIQSLADLEASYGVARDMGILPFHKRQVVRGAIIVLLPFFPLLLTVIPLEELLHRFIGLVL